MIKLLPFQVFTSGDFSLSQGVTLTVTIYALDPLTYPSLTVKVWKGVAISTTSIYLFL